MLKKTEQKIIHICAWCGCIKKKGQYASFNLKELEKVFLEQTLDHTMIISHGMCPKCSSKLE